MIAYPVALIVGLIASRYVRSPIATFAFVAATIIFIGFRYETGFDWPAYKKVWIDLSANFDFDRIFSYNCFDMELSFLALIGTMTKVFPKYEYAQFVFTLIFVISSCYLAYQFNHSKIAMVLVMILSYLIFTVGFSTVRQSLALSLFNLGLISNFRKNPISAAFLMLLAVLFQITAILYIISFIIVKFSKYKLTRVNDITLFVCIIFTLLISCLIFISVTLAFPDMMPAKVSYYMESTKAYLSPKALVWSAAMCTVFAMIGLHSLLTPNSKLTESEAELKKLILVQSAMVAGALLIPILRERVSYETWILYSVFVSINTVRFRNEAILSAMAFGVAFSALMFRYPNRMMLSPYQNFIVSEVFSSAPSAYARAARFYAEYGRLNDGAPSSHVSSDKRASYGGKLNSPVRSGSTNGSTVTASEADLVCN